MRSKFGTVTLACSLVAIVGGCSGKKAALEPAKAPSHSDPVPAAAHVPPTPAVPAPLAPMSEEEWFRTASLDELQARLSDVYFEYDSSRLGREARSVIEQNATWLKLPYNTVVIELEGHCDERGTAQYNLALGERRSMAVSEFLMSLGIPRDRVRAVSYGKERPRCTDPNERCWSKNRRAHFRITSRG